MLVHYINILLIANQNVFFSVIYKLKPQFQPKLKPVEQAFIYKSYEKNAESRLQVDNSIEIQNEKYISNYLKSYSIMAQICNSHSEFKVQFYQ